MLGLNRAATPWALKPLGLQMAPCVMQHRSLATLTDQDTDHERYWSKVTPWRDVSIDEFVSYRWQLRNTVQGTPKLYKFLTEALPSTLGPTNNPLLKHIRTKDEFIEDAAAGIKTAPMAIRLTPQILSRVDWNNPLDDPIRRQFIPLRSGLIPDHPKLTLDSLGEEADSPVPGLVHRYPGRALFLATSICPVYCRFCTRSYAVGANTETVSKTPQKPSRKRWELVFEHLEMDKSIQDVVVSGGDAYYLQPDDLRTIGERLLGIPHIKRFRLASKGLAVAPGRILDEQDDWARTLIDISNLGRREGKQVCLHTHFNHANEVTWITRAAARKLYAHGVIVRNQSVLLRGVNDSKGAMCDLIEALSDMNIQPYYVYQCDMVSGIEDLRTPLSTIRNLDNHVRGKFSGFMVPSFVVDLPGGGGKRLVSTAESYDMKTGISIFRAPGLPGKKGQVQYTYYDPAPRSELEIEQRVGKQPLAKTEQGIITQRIPARESPVQPRVSTSAHLKHEKGLQKGEERRPANNGVEVPLQSVQSFDNRHWQHEQDMDSNFSNDKHPPKYPGLPPTIHNDPRPLAAARGMRFPHRTLESQSLALPHESSK